MLWSGVASLCKIESELVFMAAPDPFQQQQGKASIFDETREQNRVTKCILTKAKRKEKREKGPAEAIGELQCTVLVFYRGDHHSKITKTPNVMYPVFLYIILG